MDHRNPAVEAKLGQWRGMLETVTVKEEVLGDGDLLHAPDTAETRNALEALAERRELSVWTRESTGPHHKRRYRVWILGSPKLIEHLNRENNVIAELDDLLILAGMPWHSQALFPGWFGTLLGFADKRPGVKFHHVPFGVIQDDEHGLKDVLELNQPLLKASRHLLNYIIHDWDNWPALSETDIDVLESIAEGKNWTTAEIVKSSGHKIRAVQISLKTLQYWALVDHPGKRSGYTRLPSGQRYMEKLRRAP